MMPIPGDGTVCDIATWSPLSVIRPSSCPTNASLRVACSAATRFRAARCSITSRGDRLAYDPDRGRVWSICGSCTRWNLIPADERFDAIDAPERAVQDRALYLASTAHISLHQVDDLSVIRVGRARLVERTAWRYGRELLARNASYWRPRTRYVAAAAGALAVVAERLGGFSLDRDWGPSGTADILRWQRFGSVAWHGRARCDTCGSVLHTLHFDSSWWLYPPSRGRRAVHAVRPVDAGQRVRPRR
jgi:hypothetical protein